MSFWFTKKEKTGKTSILTAGIPVMLVIVLLGIISGLIIPQILSKDKGADRFALKVFAERTLVGATLIANGEKVGTLEEFTEKGAYVSKWLPTGDYNIQITMNGVVKHEENISIGKDDSEYYLHIEESETQQ